MRGFDPGCYYSTSEMIFKFKLKSVLLVVHSRAHSHNLWKIENISLANKSHTELYGGSLYYGLFIMILNELSQK